MTRNSERSWPAAASTSPPGGCKASPSAPRTPRSAADWVGECARVTAHLGQPAHGVEGQDGPNPAACRGPDQGCGGRRSVRQQVQVCGVAGEDDVRE